MSQYEDPKPCRGPICKAKIVWGETLAGQRIPLDREAAVYRVIHRGPGGRRIVERIHGAMVSHFATCPDDVRFSKRRRKPAPTPKADPEGVQYSKCGP